MTVATKRSICSFLDLVKLRPWKRAWMIIIHFKNDFFFLNVQVVSTLLKESSRNCWSLWYFWNIWENLCPSRRTKSNGTNFFFRSFVILIRNSSFLIPKKVNGKWVNSAGELVALKWAKGQPSNSNKGKVENCLQFWGNTDPGKMNDQYCTDRSVNVICETLFVEW